jgi:hypothetical protein
VTKPKAKPKPMLEKARAAVDDAIKDEKEAIGYGPSANIMVRIHNRTAESLAKLSLAGKFLMGAVDDDEMDRATEARITDDLVAAEKDDRESVHAVDEQDAKESLTHAVAKKSAALHLIEAALK